jgi:hypothetical protein
MAAPQKTPQVNEVLVPYLGKTFGEMNGSEKMTFLGKAVVMICTGGFMFPNVFVE